MLNKILVYGIIAAIIMGMSYCTYDMCKEREPGRIGSIEVDHRSECVSYHTRYYRDSNGDEQSSRRCTGYVCQEVTTRIGKHIWNDETLNVKDLYSGRCRTKASVGDW